MNPRGKKLQPKLSLDMPFDEALARFAQVKPAELDDAVERSKEGVVSKREGENDGPKIGHKLRRKRH